MASIIVTLASGTSGKLYATASGLMNTAATAPSNRITISCSVAGVTGADVELRKATDGSQITNCPMIAITWKPGGYTQEVLLGSTTAGKPMAQFKYGNTTISYDSTTTVPDGGTITVTAVAASGTVDSTAPTDIGIGGYYYAHNGRGGRYNYSDGAYTYEEYAVADSNQGIRSVPARCGNRVPVDVSFKYNGSAKYFIYMMMRGWNGSSAGCPGDMGMLAGSGPIVNSTFQTSWGDNYKTYRMDVFALSASGIYPSLADMPGDGTSESSCPSNSTWITWPADSSLSMYSVKYYATNGSTILRSNTEAKLDLDFEKVSGSAITFYKGDEIYRYLNGDSGTLVIPSGYRFKGWQKSTDGGSTWSSDITSSSGMGKVGSTDVRLKLVVEPNTIVVTFNKGTGNAPNISNTTVTIGNTYGSGTNGWPTDPTKDQDAQYTYSFKGWYTESSGGTKITSSTTVTRTTNQTLYAQYNSTLRSYDITYTGTSGSASVNLPYGTAVTIDNAGGSGESSFTVTGAKTVSNPTRTGYTFAGYTYNSSTHTLTATWTAVTYTITYDSASGSAVDSQTYNIATNVTLRGASTRTGYTFNGWKLGTAVNTWSAKTYSASENVGTGKYGNLTLVAQWGATSYTATFAIGGGTWSDSTTGNKTVSYNITQTLAAPATISRTGYTFAGWKITSAGGNWVNGTNYNNSPQTKITGATGQYGAVTFTAQWNINSYQLTTSVNDSIMGSASGAGTYEYNSSHAVTATPNPGYEFVSWTLTGALTGTYTDNPHSITMPAGSVNAKATFKAKTYTLSFDAHTVNYPRSADDGGQEVADPASVTVTFNQPYPALPTFSDIDYDGWKWDYTFSGWWTDAPVLIPDTDEDGEQDTASRGTRTYGNKSDELYTTVGNQTLYAFWERDRKKYDVRWIEADAFENEELEFDDDVLSDTAPSFDKPDPEHRGYTFKGWTPVGADQQGYPKPEGSLPMVMNDLVYKAVYDLIPGVIKFEIPAGVTPGSFDDIPFNIESLPIVVDGREGAPYAVSKPGNEFIGWMAYRKEGDEYIPLLGSAVQRYQLTSWVDYDIILKPKFVPALSPFEPKPGYPGNNDDDPDNDNNNYGIPIDDLDDSQQYKLKFEVEGDRESDPIFDISVGTITKRNNKWVWNYESDVLTKSQMKDLMEEDLFILDVWRCIVWRTTGILKVTLETYENGTLLGEGTTVNNPFELYGWMTPYINDEPVDDSSDVVPVEGVDSIENLDLWANGVDTRFTKRFIGNGRSTVDVIMTAHNTDDGKVPAAGDVVHGEVLYGAVPTIYYVSLNSDDTNGGATYNGNVPNPQTDADKRALQQQWESLLTTSDEPNNSYRQELRITTNPFPNIVHRESKDEIDAVLRLRVYDSRHLNYKDI